MYWCENGRVRALLDDRGQTLKSAGPGQPVEILGLNGTPMAGDSCVVVESEARAREIAEYRTRVNRDREAARVRVGQWNRCCQPLPLVKLPNCRL